MLDDFLSKYQKGDIVYPSVVARYLGIAVEKALFHKRSSR